MTTGKMIERLRELKVSVLEDGKIDWDETEQLMLAVRPLAAKHGFLFEDFEQCLQKCRADEKITPEESKELALYLEYLCNFFANRRLTWGLAVISVAIVIASAAAVISRVVAA